MRIFEQEFEKGGNNKKRILFAVGFEEVELLHAFLSQELRYYPELQDPAGYGRIKNMLRALAIYLGKKKERPPKSSDFPCPICNRKLRGEKAVELHLKDVHPDYKSKSIDPPEKPTLK